MHRQPLILWTFQSHTCDISRFRRGLPIWSLSSRSHSRETKPPDDMFFQCHFSRTVFLSEHFIVYGNIYLANKLFTAQKCLTFIDLIDDHWCVSDSIDVIKINTCGQLNRLGVRLIYPNQKNDSKSWFQNHKHDPATLQTLCFNSMIQEMYLICFETWTEYVLLVWESHFWFAQIKGCNTPSPPSWMIDSLKIINWVWSIRFEILFPIRSNKTVNQNHDFESWFRFR